MNEICRTILCPLRNVLKFYVNRSDVFQNFIPIKIDHTTKLISKLYASITFFFYHVFNLRVETNSIEVKFNVTSLKGTTFILKQEQGI